MSTERSKIVVYKSGMGCNAFCFLLTLLFATAKLTGLVAWSWPICFIPIIICPGIPLAMVFTILFLTVALLMTALPFVFMGIICWIIAEKVFR